MILGSSAIKERLDRGEIFLTDTWDPNCIKEASYTLRVADDGLVVDGTSYPPGEKYPKSFITIEPGSIAILSTVERLSMPEDIVGQPGIRLNYAAQGLTGLMGIQVDPAYGAGLREERLYLRVANLGNEDVKFQLGEAVFNIQFQEIDGGIDKTLRGPTWNRLVDALIQQSEPSWTYVTRVQSRLDDQVSKVRTDLEREVDRVRNGLQPLVMFGVFLVAATLLGVVVTFLLNSRGTPEAPVPIWVTNVGWIILLVGLGIVVVIAVVATIIVGFVTAVRGINEARRR